MRQWTVLLALVIAVLWFPSPAQAGGVECPERTGTFVITGGGGGGMDGVFTYDIGDRMIAWKAYEPYQVVRTDAGTQTEGWDAPGRKDADGWYRYVSDRDFTKVTFCLSPDPTNGQPVLTGVAIEPVPAEVARPLWQQLWPWFAAALVAIVTFLIARHRSRPV